MGTDIDITMKDPYPTTTVNSENSRKHNQYKDNRDDNMNGIDDETGSMISQCGRDDSSQTKIGTDDIIAVNTLPDREENDQIEEFGTDCDREKNEISAHNDHANMNNN